MSQVVVTDDKLKVKREASKSRERAIDIEGEMAKWRLSDITGFDPVAAAVGLAVLPIALSWFVIGTVVKAAIFVVIAFSQIVARMIGKTAS